MNTICISEQIQELKKEKEDMEKDLKGMLLLLVIIFLVMTII